MGCDKLFYITDEIQHRRPMRATLQGTQIQQKAQIPYLQSRQ